jgi:hypothetical protein
MNASSATATAAVLVGLWIACAIASGAALAALARRRHPSLSFRRLWVLYSAVVSLVAALAFVVLWA